MDSSKSPEQLAQLKNVVNEIFALFELAFHNQYNKAFASDDKENLAKRLWFSQLKHIDVDLLRAAAQKAIQNSEYLPTIRSVLKEVEQAMNLPSSYHAYLECCRAPSPKASFAWSHPAVYFAGKACGWNFLSSAAESQGLPRFTAEYERICQQVLQGETLPEIDQLDQQPALAIQSATEANEDKSDHPQNSEQAREQLNALFK